MGAAREEIFCARMKTVWTTPTSATRLSGIPCSWTSQVAGASLAAVRPYRAQTKGKIESGVKYIRRNFLCGLLGREPVSVADFNAELRCWVAEVANLRVHGTTR
jgi:transposase